MKRFNLLHPSVAIIYFVGIQVLIFISDDVPRRTLAAAGLLLTAVFFNGANKVVKTCKWLVPLSALVILLTPLFNHRGRTVLFYFWGGAVTMEAVWLGVSQAFFIAGLVFLFMSFNRVVTPPVLLFFIGKYMPRAALLLNMSLQTGARLSKRAGDFIDVQKTREHKLSKRKHSLLLLDAFTSRGLEEGLETAEVLKARDYGKTGRTHYHTYYFKTRDAVSLAALLALTAAASFYYAFFAVLILFPLILEGIAYARRYI